MRPEATVDLECFHNWFLVGITDHVNNVEWDFQLAAGHPLDIASITTLLQHYTVVTFNGQNYDIPMLLLALQGADNATLKAANDDIILNGLKSWQFYRKYGCYPPEWLDHIDVSEPTPGVRVSLKQYMCRMSSLLVQDTPVDFNAPLPLEQAPHEIFYCRNDRNGTNELRQVVDERIKVRVRLSERYGVDLRSKSDAQMAEAMVKAEWSRRMRDSKERHSREWDKTQPYDTVRYPHLSVLTYDIDREGNPRPVIPTYTHGTTFKVRVPEYIEFVTPYMQQFLQTVRECDFFISNKDEAELMGMDGKNIRTGVLIPNELKGRDILIGATKYRVGIGGLHSQEASVSYRTTPGVCTLMTADVASYYPSLILNAGMNPPQLGPLFLTLYQETYDERLVAKRDVKLHPVDSAEYNELKTIESGHKIILNGTFGKLFSRFSIFYAPEFGIAVTIGGQLSLLMLIERLELSGIRVVSANTDGVELCVPASREWIAQNIIDWWQAATRLTLETKTYTALYSRDVNNYISLQADGSVKRKGVFGESGVLNNKHPDCDVCADAVTVFLTSGMPLEATIVACTDIRKFVRVRGAKGGAVWTGNGQPLGRAVRWYYATGEQHHIIDAKSGNKVAGSDGAMPVMLLPDSLPGNVDYDWYIQRASEMLTEVGYGRENQR